MWKFAFVSMNPFKPLISTYKFSKLISMHFLHELVLRENLIEEQSIFPLVTKFILTILSLDDELLLSGENQCWSVIWAFKG